ncbi:MAG: RluA family pseudouridine synthase [Bacteroidales bacterium]|nr:RluA family pseudouridine synthase [Bacteroidales bacterium]
MSFLIQSFPEKSRTTIKSLLTHKQVLVNQQVTSLYNYKLKPGDRVELFKGKGLAKHDLEGIKIVHEDDFIIVIEKASGLLSIATSGEKEKTAYQMLSRYVKMKDPLNLIFILHRLDRETSGVMMFARNKDVQATLQYNWREMVVERTYTAVVEGQVEKQQGIINSRLLESKAMKIHSTKKQDEGQEAITHYKLVKQSKDYALMEISLETGRKNQIRVHMQEMGNPVAGDKKYGAQTNPLHRLALHASLLVFRHPVTKEVLRFESPAPISFTHLVNR